MHDPASGLGHLTGKHNKSHKLPPLDELKTTIDTEEELKDLKYLLTT